MQEGGELLRVGHVRMQPHLFCGRFQNHRHPGMNRLQTDRRLCGDDRTRMDFFSLCIYPRVIQSGKGEIVAGVGVDVVGLLSLPSGVLPLVKAASGYNAPL